MTKNMAEKKLEKKIILSLKMLGYYVYKTASSGSCYDYNLQFNEAGIVDLIVIGKGKVIFLEVKTKTGRQSISQKVFEEICKKNKVKCALVRSIKDAVESVK